MNRNQTHASLTAQERRNPVIKCLYFTWILRPEQELSTRLLRVWLNEQLACGVAFTEDQHLDSQALIYPG